jgi:hypothetical protein
VTEVDGVVDQTGRLQIILPGVTVAALTSLQSTPPMSLQLSEADGAAIIQASGLTPGLVVQVRYRLGEA